MEAPLTGLAEHSPSTRQRWLYSIANLGLTIPRQAVGAYLLFYYVDVKSLPAAWAARALVVYALYDALNNPVLGYLSDRTRTRWGRRIPYVLFAGLPFTVLLALIFMAPFSGVEQPIALLVYFVVTTWLWEALSTAVQTGYFSLLPEMYSSYDERTQVAVSMNMVQVGGIFIAVAMSPLIYSRLGWPAMGSIYAAVAAVALYAGLRGMFERKSSVMAEKIPFWRAVRATIVNRSFVTIAIAQTFRFVGTNALLAGTAFYAKYSLQAGSGVTSAILTVAFISTGLTLGLWRRFVAQRFEARTTLMIANGVMGVAVLPLALAQTTTAAIVSGAGLGLGLAGLILIGDVILADVIDEDELRTGQRREGMYFGTSKFIMTAANAIVALWFGWITGAFGYESQLVQQPDSVGTGFRVFMSVPVVVSSVLAIGTLLLYPLHGERLQEVKLRLAARHAGAEETIGI
ncbi:MAG: MFS transporter [Anaerolineae bacterium]|nr:MFS transporter [Anaerolineae bacterium]